MNPVTMESAGDNWERRTGYFRQEVKTKFIYLDDAGDENIYGADEKL